MTNEEAKRRMEICRDFLANNYSDMGEPNFTAFNMAIKALEQTELNPSYNGVKSELNPCEDYISRNELLSRIDAERKHLLDIKMDGAEHVIVHHARRIIEDMPSITPKALEQQPCEDAISREAVLRLVEQYPNIIGNRCVGLMADIKHLPSVTPSYNSIKTELKPCEDCVSRQAVIDELDKYIEKAQSTGTKDDFISFQELVVKHLPSVTPKPKTGHWIDVEGLDSALWHNCSECGETEFYATDYCPNCGAKMEVEE